MRKLAPARRSQANVAQCILYECEDGVYVFPCTSTEDGSAQGDHFFQSREEAEHYCEEAFGIVAADWKVIDDPLPDCQHDWVAPVRVKGRAQGKPQWGIFEKLVNGHWQEFRQQPS